MLTTATGKSILAMLDDEQVRSIYEASRERLEAQDAAASIPTLSELKNELQAVSSRGYATTSSWRDGVFATGAAIVDPSGRPIAAISISTPENRSSEEARAQHAHLLLVHAAQINERMH